MLPLARRARRERRRCSRWPCCRCSAASPRREDASARCDAARSRSAPSGAQAKDARTARSAPNTSCTKFYGEVLPRDRQRGAQGHQPLAAAGRRGCGPDVQEQPLRPDAGARQPADPRHRQGHAAAADYPNIRKFLYAVETAQEFVVVERVELAQSADAQPANGPARSHTDVVTYFLTDRHATQ